MKFLLVELISRFLRDLPKLEVLKLQQCQRNSYSVYYKSLSSRNNFLWEIKLHTMRFLHKLCFSLLNRNLHPDVLLKIAIYNLKGKILKTKIKRNVNNT